MHQIEPKWANRVKELHADGFNATQIRELTIGEGYESKRLNKHGQKAKGMGIGTIQKICMTPKTVIRRTHKKKLFTNAENRLTSIIDIVANKKNTLAERIELASILLKELQKNVPTE